MTNPWLAGGVALVWSAELACVAAGNVYGWRGDGSGRFPEADPPVHWSAEHNVTWKTRLPDAGNASPVLVEDRIVVTAEPDIVVCVRLNDGAELWRRANPYLGLFPEQERAAVAERQEGAGKIYKRLTGLQRERRKAEKALKKDAGNEELKDSVEKLKAQEKQAAQELEPLREDLRPPTHKVNGYASATPVSNGRRVLALFGSGILACYDMEGELQWSKLVERPTHVQGHSASPVIVGDRVIVHIRNVTALAIADGKVLWTAASRPRWGAPSVVRVGEQAGLLTAGGELLRTSDGAVVWKAPCRLSFAAPIVHAETAFFMEHNGAAVKLPDNLQPGAKVEILWRTKPQKDRYYASALYHEGKVYAMTQKHIFSVVDSGTGEVVYSDKLKMGGGTVYPSITLAGNHLYVGSDNGTTLVLDPGPPLAVLATNRLEAYRSSPVFTGRRMLVRGLQHLYCIENAGDERP